MKIEKMLTRSFKIKESDAVAVADYFDKNSMNMSDWIRKQLNKLIEQDKIQEIKE
ncbi:hypothetical protein [Neobacillus ginsengisoli]|uniref:Uncharacterized protein n=1 Tax=Neobacillus ginsengisoli TaxID=904295 RepID=A0ABT9XQY8_9BACI|nr:hypothetical protein [Neobacillus ginsengisoli]MDQ0197948.1 hypothetical protein [Neobacillus ginsengisoli]